MPTFTIRCSSIMIHRHSQGNEDFSERIGIRYKEKLSFHLMISFDKCRINYERGIPHLTKLQKSVAEYRPAISMASAGTVGIIESEVKSANEDK